MNEKIHLIVEETKCDPKEALLALEIAKYDVEKALHLVGNISNHIIVIKSKFIIKPQSLYGLLIIIFDLREKVPVRIRSVISYNPLVYETQLNAHWYEFEKQLYSYRLQEGSMQAVTQEFEKYTHASLTDPGNNEIYTYLRQEYRGTKWMESILTGILQPQLKCEQVDSQFSREALNLNQYKYWQKSVNEHPRDSTVHNGQGLNIQLELISDDQTGTRADKLVPGDQVMCIFTDGRDIAQYVAHLLGGRSQGVLQPVTIKIETVELSENKVRVVTRLAPGITGWAEENLHKNVIVIKHSRKLSFLQKILKYLRLA